MRWSNKFQWSVGVHASAEYRDGKPKPKQTKRSDTARETTTTNYDDDGEEIFSQIFYVKRKSEKYEMRIAYE